jgi:myo-inositol-1(or 4)-monophosphatase
LLLKPDLASLDVGEFESRADWIMNLRELKSALDCAEKAARQAGRLMRQNLHAAKKVNEECHHDIKLELDVRCQKLIERTLHKSFPAFAVLGEEGVSGSADAEARWVVDPIDGTVNFAHDVPHACSCIALQVRSRERTPSSILQSPSSYQSVVGITYDPFCDEMWTAIKGQPARMNGRVIRVSRRAKLAEAMVTFGFSKSKANLEKSLPYFAWLCRRARKVRIMGSAGLGLTYVACGRFDAYVERKIRLWDVAAGALIVECAGGTFWSRPMGGHEAYSLVASNGPLDALLPRPR